MVKVDGGRWGGLHAGMSKVGNSYELLTTYEAATIQRHVIMLSIYSSSLITWSHQ